MRERTKAILLRLIHSEIPIPIKLLATEYQVGERTVRNELGEINAFLAGCHLAACDSVRNQGVRLQLSEAERAALLTLLDEADDQPYYTRSQRILDIILDIAFGAQAVYLNQKERAFQVSKSTVDEDIRQIRVLLNHYDVSVHSSVKQGLYFVADEDKIRQMLFTIIEPMLETPNKVEQDILYQYVNRQLFQEMEAFYDDYISTSEESHYRKMFVLILAIWVKRLQGRHVIRTSAVKSSSETSEIATLVDKLVAQKRLAPSAHERDYLITLLQSLQISAITPPLNWLEIQIETAELIKFVEDETGIPFNVDDQQLHGALYYHLIGMLERMNVGIRLSNPLRDRIIDEYGVVFTAVKTFFQTKSALVNTTLSDDEVAFLTIHFSISLSEINQEQSYWFKAVVICNHGVVTGRLLAERLKEHFNIEIVGIFSTRELAQVAQRDCDLIFTTVEMAYPDKPILKLDTVLNDEGILLVRQFLEFNKHVRRHKRTDYNEMFQSLLAIMDAYAPLREQDYLQIQQLFDDNGLKINVREVQPMIEDLLYEHHTRFIDRETDWREAIRIAAEPLLVSEVISNDYIDAMIHSVDEYGPYIVMAPGLALAHARPEEGALKLGLSLAVFNTPVIFNHDDNDPVKIVFCLSAVDSFSHLNIMRSLVTLIREEGRLEKLSHAVSYDDVKAVLFTEGEG